MHGDIIKGSDEENNHEDANTKTTLEVIEDTIKHPRYIIFDFETDTSNNILEDGSVLLHQVMLFRVHIVLVVHML